MNKGVTFVVASKLYCLLSKMCLSLLIQPLNCINYRSRVVLSLCSHYCPPCMHSIELIMMGQQQISAVFIGVCKMLIQEMPCTSAAN